MTVDHFYPIARHMNPIPHRMKVTADQIRVIVA
jgi:hypothetical protein